MIYVSQVGPNQRRWIHGNQLTWCVSAAVEMMSVSRDFPLFMIVDWFVWPLAVANNIRKPSAFDTVLLMFFAANI